MLLSGPSRDILGRGNKNAISFCRRRDLFVMCVDHEVGAQCGYVLVLEEVFRVQRKDAA